MKSSKSQHMKPFEKFPVYWIKIKTNHEEISAWRAINEENKTKNSNCSLFIISSHVWIVRASLDLFCKKIDNYKRDMCT